MHPQINVIGFDGLNNSGKGTQIKFLRNSLFSEGIPSIVLRGDGRRRGLGNEEKDPISYWWQGYYKEIANRSIQHEDYEMSTIASNRLNREIYVTIKRIFPQFLREFSLARGIVILDRTIISRLFTLSQFGITPCFPEHSTYKGPGTNERSIILPDLTFLLHTEKEVLLSRSKLRDDPPAKKEFNEHMITNYYSTFSNLIHSLPHELVDRVRLIDASKEAGEISEEINYFSRNLIFGNNFISEAEYHSGNIEL